MLRGIYKHEHFKHKRIYNPSEEYEKIEPEYDV